MTFDSPKPRCYDFSVCYICVLANCHHVHDLGQKTLRALVNKQIVTCIYQKIQTYVLLAKIEVFSG